MININRAVWLRQHRGILAQGKTTKRGRDTMRGMRVLVTGAICLGFILGLSAFAPASAQQKPIVLKASHNAPRNITVAVAYEAWLKEIEKRTNGMVKAEFYWASSLLKVSETVKGTGAGIADVCFDVPGYHPSETPLSTIGELGYVTNHGDTAARALTELYQQYPVFNKEFDRHNLKVMFFVPFPPTIIGFVKPARTLEDLKGRKIRALGLLNDVVAKLGGTPVGIPLNDMYESLSRKVIEGYTGFGLSGVHGFKLDEVCKHYVDFGYGSYNVGIVFMNKDRWNSLPPDVRKVIEEVNVRAIDIYNEVFAKAEAADVAPLKPAGCTFYTLPPDEMNRWKSLVVPGIWNDWIEKQKQAGPSQEFFDRYLQLVKKYEPQSKYVNPFPK
jgi:TRAP-type C4-dicarboxylate transport system substrate-binding protein